MNSKSKTLKKNTFLLYICIFSICLIFQDTHEQMYKQKVSKKKKKGCKSIAKQFSSNLAVILTYYIYDFVITYQDI